MKSFTPGSRVEHPDFGQGTMGVLVKDPKHKRQVQVLFDFPPGKRLRWVKMSDLSRGKPTGFGEKKDEDLKES